MSMTLSHFTESHQVLVVSMLRCLARIIPGLIPGSRYVASLFWLSIGFLQLSYIPLFAASLELMLVALRAIASSAPPGQSLAEVLMDARKGLGSSACKLDQVCGVSFDTDPCFSLVAVVFKGVRHPSTRKLAMEVLMELLVLSSERSEPDDGMPSIAPSGVAFFLALLPSFAGSSAELKMLFAAGGMEVSDEAVNDVSTLPVFEILAIPSVSTRLAVDTLTTRRDNSTAVLIISLVMSMLITAGTDVEKLVLYRMLADASTEMPEVVNMT